MANCLKELLEKEREFCNQQVVGSKEYVESSRRMMEIQKQIDETELEKEKELGNRKDAKDRTIVEWAKIGTNIVLPVIGLVVLVAEQKEITFTGALRDVTKCFLPKKL